MTDEQLKYISEMKSYSVFAFKNGKRKRINMTSFENGKRFAGNYHDVYCHANTEIEVVKMLGFSLINDNWKQLSFMF